MNYFSEDFIEKVRLASDIVSLINEDVSLKGQGDRHMGLCPFPDHKEKTPSFSVSGSKQVYHCFGCQKSGNIYTYLQDLRGMTFVESIHYLARQARIDLPKTYNKKEGSQTRGLFDLNEKVCQFYQKKLFECSKDHPVWKYLKGRGYTEETIKSFRLGYAPKGKFLLEALTSSEEQNRAHHLGLLSKGENQKFYDNFRNRLIFPIISTRKQVIGFGARALDDSLPKYINSKESKVFHKGKSFYGLSESAKYLRQTSSLLVVEGYTDFLSLWQSGFKNIVATLGTALTLEHAKLLKRYVDSVILIFDGDEAGVKASERSLPLLLSESLEVKTVSLPDKTDPDDFIKEKGKESFENLLKDSEDLFFQVLKDKKIKLKKENRSQVHLLEEMLPFLSVIKNDSLKTLYKQRVLDSFGMDKQAMEKVLDKSLRSSTKPSSYLKSSEVSKDQTKEERVEKFSLTQALEAERLLLVLSLDSRVFLDFFIDQRGSVFFKTKPILLFFDKIIAKYRQKPDDFDKMLHHAMNEFSDNFLLLKESYPILGGATEEDLKKIFNDSLTFLKKKKISAEVNQLISEIKMSSGENIEDLKKVFQLTKEKLHQKNSSTKKEKD